VAARARERDIRGTSAQCNVVVPDSILLCQLYHVQPTRPSQKYNNRGRSPGAVRIRVRISLSPFLSSSAHLPEANGVGADSLRQVPLLHALAKHVIIALLLGELGEERKLIAAGPALIVRRAEETEYLVDLVDLRSAAQQRLVDEELAEDTANAPHVDGGRVLLRASEQLGCTVRQGDYLLCV